MCLRHIKKPEGSEPSGLKFRKERPAPLGASLGPSVRERARLGLNAAHVLAQLRLNRSFGFSARGRHSIALHRILGGGSFWHVVHELKEGHIGLIAGTSAHFHDASVTTRARSKAFAQITS